MKKSRPIKVLEIGPMPPPAGGVSVHLSRLLARYGRDERVRVQVCDPGKRKLFTAEGSSSGIWRLLSAFLAADIIHIHLNHRIKTWIAFFARLFFKKVIHTRHNLRQLNDPGNWRMADLANRIILVSRPEHFPQHLTGKKITILPAYLAPSERSELPKVLQRDLQGGARFLLAVSAHARNRPSLINGKDVYGFDLLLEAIGTAGASRVFSGVVLVLLDESGAMKEYYRDRIRNASEKSGIKILYLAEPVDAASLLPDCRLFIRPTRSDGDSIAVREALSFGVPVLASDCGQRPRGCTVFKSQSVEELAGNMTRLMEHPYRIVFPQPDFGEELIQVYQEVMNPNVAPGQLV